MNFAALSPSVQVALLFFLTLLPLCWVMKWIAFRGRPEALKPGFILTLWPSPRALEQSLPLSKAPWLLTRCGVGLVACIGAYALYWSILGRMAIPTPWLAYPGAIILWLVTETLGSIVPFLAMPSGRLLSLPHGAPPLLARSVSDFWSRRWNVWMSGCLHQILFRPLRRRPIVALFATFVVSGLLHEMVINLPLYIVTGKARFGSMLIYFLVQPFGILIERRIRRPGPRRILAWLFVFVPAPLIVNEGLLRILGLWPA